MHGGDIYTNNVDLDFSVNLNPLGMPEEVRRALADAAAGVERYPDPEYRGLRREIGRYYGVPAERIVVGNGASELICAVCRTFLTSEVREDTNGSIISAVEPGGQREKARALILAPGFTGYRRALSAVHADVIAVGLREENNWIPDDSLEKMIATTEPQLVLLANPSNPTGVFLTEDRMIQIAKVCDAVGAVLCVDECFLELSGRRSQRRFGESHLTNVILLNAITKTFAVPGVRLGYAFCGTEETAIRLREQLPEWNVSSMAEEAGVAAFRTDPSYLEKAVSLIRRERRYLAEELSACGFRVCVSEANYLLFHGPEGLYEQMLQHKILIRDCSDYEGLGAGWYRVAVRRHEENQKLVRAALL